MRTPPDKTGCVWRHSLPSARCHTNNQMVWGCPHFWPVPSSTKSAAPLVHIAHLLAPCPPSTLTPHTSNRTPPHTHTCVDDLDDLHVAGQHLGQDLDGPLLKRLWHHSVVGVVDTLRTVGWCLWMGGGDVNTTGQNRARMGKDRQGQLLPCCLSAAARLPVHLVVL